MIINKSGVGIRLEVALCVLWEEQHTGSARLDKSEKRNDEIASAMPKVISEDKEDVLPGKSF